MKIYIDIGHGGKDPGAVSGVFKEHDIATIYANAMADRLKTFGAEVKMEPGDLTLEQSAAASNSWKADILISCHLNAGGGDRGEVYYSKESGAKQLANAVAAGLKAAGQTVVNLIYKPNSAGTAEYMGILRYSTMPGVLIEPCFLDNAADRAIIATVDKQRELGIHIADAIASAYGLQDPATEYKAIIQSHVGFSDPVGVWVLLDRHPFAAELYKKWAESYAEKIRG